jgi:hypothetical protein
VPQSQFTPLTATGVVLLLVVPLPSSPRKFWPQRRSTVSVKTVSADITADAVGGWFFTG